MQVSIRQWFGSDLNDDWQNDNEMEPSEYSYGEEEIHIYGNSDGWWKHFK